MARPIPPPMPCPVQLGSVTGDSLEAQLHEYVRQGNYEKVKKILKKGVFVDAVNSMGQTSLFVAALLGLGKIVDVLLDNGSDPNHRCYDGSTPVHAAAFSGNQCILSRILDEGGDLRLHSKEGKSPQCWAMSAGKESSAQMLEFIQRCRFHMQAAIQNFPSDLLGRVGSSKMLVYSPTRFGGLVQGNVGSPLRRFLKGEVNAAKNIYSLGFGKFCLAGGGHLGYVTSLPITGEKDVVQADDEPMFSYPVGPYMIMRNLMWGGSRVTVKELSFKPHQHSRKLHLADLLLAEQEHSGQLRHARLLQLVSVCLSSDLEKTRLIYERVNFGSLYSILHERRTEFPVLHTEVILGVLLQILDALRFLHYRGFIHRSLSSYAIQIVSSGEAKLCNLEYMIESKDGGEHSDLTRIPVPVQLYKWCSPEVILEKMVTEKSDIYSFCAVVQEALTETPPWTGFEDSVIKTLVVSGKELEADVRLPLPYYDIVKSGLEPRQKNRSMELQDIQYIMKNDLKDLTGSPTGHANEMSKAQRLTVFADRSIGLASAFSCEQRTQELQGKEVAEPDSSSSPRDSLLKEEGPLVDQGAPTNQEPIKQDKNSDVASELETLFSASDADDSLRSFEANEIFVSYPELDKDFLEEAGGLGQTQQDEKKQQKEEDKASHRKMYEFVHCEESPGSEEGGSSESSTEYTSEELESISEASDLCVLAQVREDSRKRVSSVSKTDQYIGKCFLELKIMQSMVQQAADSLRRTEEKVDNLEASEKQKKVLQENRMNQHSKQISQEGHWSRSEETSQDINNVFPGVNTFLWKAVGPPSSVYVPPRVTEVQGALGGDRGQALSKTVKEIEHSLPHESVRRKKKFNLQCQRGGDSHSAASGSEEKGWCYRKPRSKIHSSKMSEERRMMQSDWRTEVKEMARRVALGQLKLSSPSPASEYPSESQTESVKEAFHHVTLRVQESQEQQRCRWQTGDNVENWDLSSEDRAESEEGDLELASSFAGENSPSQDEQAESGQVENLSRGQSREFHHSCNSSHVSEEFFTPDPDYVFPPATWGSSEVEISAAKSKLEDGCEGFLQKQVPEDAGSGIQVSGGKTPFCSTAAQNSGRNTLGVNQLSHMPVASVGAAQEEILWEEQEACKGKELSVIDIQDLSSIPCEQEMHSKDMDCTTPRATHAPTSISTPISSVPDQVKMEDRQLGKESSLWSSETFTLAEETERAHSSLDDILERLVHEIPGDAETQEQPQGHILGHTS
ncbi:inactive serine/threonine-protein kinase TEX14 isoform X2 [Heliangelus exortis]|uniref:inactive serine/threonine-protein kinase TEX14 isoform X2 n=1 Tax=Heliangelus exortis TaxID=472823 RepID=UPI003A92D387